MAYSTNIAHGLGRLLPARLRPVVRRRLVRVRQLGLTPNDGVLVSYPKSGSTWLRFLLCYILCGQEADFDSIRDLLPPIGRHGHAPRLLPNGGRMVRTHEPLGVLARRPGQPVVYLVRDGRDVAVSYLHHLRRVGHFDGDLAAFLPKFLAGEVDSYGSWHAHVLGAVASQHRDGSAFLTVRYEDLRRDTDGELTRIVQFLRVEPEAGRVEEAVAAHSKRRMRAKEQTSRLLQRQNIDGSLFVRPDGGPSWQELLEPAMIFQFERVAGAALRAFDYLPSGIEPSP